MVSSWDETIATARCTLRQYRSSIKTARAATKPSTR